MGELGCGDLVYELREQFEMVDRGALVRIVTNDPGARHDVPSWCSLTGHTLVDADAPYYLIAARQAPPGNR